MRQFQQVVSEFDHRNLRNRLGRFATGITVITVRDTGGRYIGRTINSFSSVSLHPPLILWSLDGSSSSLPAFETSGHFAVNILGVDQIFLAEKFAKLGPVDPFEGLQTSEGLGGAPVLEGCAVVFECRKYCRYFAGDHVIFLGEIVRYRETDRPGLVFHNGVYAVSKPHPEVLSRPAEAFYFSPF